MCISVETKRYPPTFAPSKKLRTRRYPKEMCSNSSLYHPNTGTTTDMSISLTLSSSENEKDRKIPLLPYGTPTKRPKYTYPGLFLGETGGCRRSHPSVEL